MSANPLGSILGTMPGSALAEKIFNDPESWEEAEEQKDESDAAREAMAWLEDELEKYQALGDKLGLSPIERLDMGLAGMLRAGPFPSLAQSAHTVDEKPENVSAQPIPRNNQPPPPLHLEEEKTLFPGVSQTGAGSASSTWSILELYGLNPDTPRSARRRSSPGVGTLPPSTPPKPKLSLPQLPASLPKTSTVSSLPSTSAQHQLGTRTPLPKLPIKVVPGSETPGSIRKLPVIPDPSSLHPPPNVTPSSTQPNQPPERTPRSSSALTPSPPAGPRPRSGSSTPASRKKSYETSPTPSFVISAPPVPPRPRRPLSPPSLRIGVH